VVKNINGRVGTGGGGVDEAFVVSGVGKDLLAPAQKIQTEYWGFIRHCCVVKWFEECFDHPV